MVKFYLDIPSPFWIKDSDLHHEILTGYVSLMNAILRTDNDCVAFPYRSRVNDGYSPGSDDGISYVYHATVPGKNSYCIRPGPIKGLWYMDPDGYSGWSSIAKNSWTRSKTAGPDFSESTRLINHYRSRFLSHNESKYIQPNIKDDAMIERDFVFFPLQVSNDEVLQLSPFTQVDVVRSLVELGSRYKTKVILKRHPYCKSKLIGSTLAWAAGHPHVQISDASIHQLIPSARAVVVLNSGVGLEALIHGATVYSLAASEYRHLTRQVYYLEDLGDAFIDARPRQSTEEILGLGYLLSEFFVNINDTDRVISVIKMHSERFIEERRRNSSDFAALSEQSSRLKSATTLLLAMEKQLSDVADVLLATMFQSSDDIDQNQTALLLSKAARIGVSKHRILRTDFPEILRRYVVVCHRAKEHKEALIWARKLADHTGLSDDIMLLAKSLFIVGLDDEGFSRARAAAFHENATAEALTYYARRIIGKSPLSTELALECAQRAHALAPDDPLPMWLIARANHIMGDAQAALRLVTDALKKHPDHDKLVGTDRAIRESIARKQKPGGHSPPP